MMKSKIICIVGPSGCGKTTLANYLERTLGIKTLVSYTTRPMREGESNGVNHWYVGDKDIPDKSQMLAYARFGNYHYWVNLTDVPQNDVVTYVVDEQGLMMLMEEHGEEFDIIAIYINRDEHLRMSSVDKERLHRDRNRVHMDKGTYDAVIDNNGSIDVFFDNVVKTIMKLINK